ncbi:MAG TPA: hypothetical protein VND40_03470 [Nitrososphaerales archaeon]|nr:hypothetical protein [Nitrososphaerales archaeon]
MSKPPEDFKESKGPLPCFPAKVEEGMKTVDLVPPSLFILLFGFVVVAEELHIPVFIGLSVLAILIAAMIASVVWNGGKPR